MYSDATREALNRLWIIHNFSLPSYLNYAPPRWDEEDGVAARLLDNIVRDQQQLADRIGKMVIKYGGELAMGRYPYRFTSLHDLSSPYLWAELLRYQRQTVDAIENLMTQLPTASIAQALAEECLGVAKAHLDSMRESTRDQPNSSV